MPRETPETTSSFYRNLNSFLFCWHLNKCEQRNACLCCDTGTVETELMGYLRTVIHHPQQNSVTSLCIGWLFHRRKYFGKNLEFTSKKKKYILHDNILQEPKTPFCSQVIMLSSGNLSLSWAKKVILVSFILRTSLILMYILFISSQFPLSKMDPMRNTYLLASIA